MKVSRRNEKKWARRYHALVDREFLRGLTPKEKRTLRWLNYRLDRARDAFYARIFKGLTFRTEREGAK